MTILDRLVKNLSKLPGIGYKSASRIAYFLLTADPAYTEALGRDIKELKSKIENCKICGNYTDVNPCVICSDPMRDTSVICVVEEPKNIQAIELVHDFKGLYHVLMGTISPIDGIGPDQLNIPQLLSRVGASTINEIIIATNPTVEGDTTALYLQRALKPYKVKITRLALGLPVGGDIEYTDRLTIARAFKGRTEVD